MTEYVGVYYRNWNKQRLMNELTYMWIPAVRLGIIDMAGHTNSMAYFTVYANSPIGLITQVRAFTDGYDMDTFNARPTTDDENHIYRTVKLL